VKCKVCGKDFEENQIGKSGMCVLCYLNFILTDPDMVREREEFVKISGHLSEEQLNRRFTI
jgi:hypothetical protein